TLHGRFVIHGVTRPADLTGHVVLGHEQSRVWANTPLNLKDYKIGGLSKALGLLKMHENIEVHVDVTFGHAPGAPQ
ncbi:MAG TPA: YceI family protein, partial [Gemmatimonadales bacterium]|nr:YceI family protein [Gemmatimonadales bacterium]